jgi:hypothetical protein
MSKRKKRRKKAQRRTQMRVVPPGRMNIRGEAEYIIGCAARLETHVVSLGPLVFFSTGTGDAWMLDPEDHFACELARDGQAQPSAIQETATNFQIDWPATYQIEGDLFVVAERTGRIRSISGYPLQEILRSVRNVRG